jgi:glycosyltransferase involved in cell wall biosynthesis
LAPEIATIGYMGALSRNYDFNPTLKVMQQLIDGHPRRKLIIGGSGPRQDALLAQIRQARLESHVLMLGAVPHERVGEIIAAFDICLLPPSMARLKETEGVFNCMKLAEYAACGRPILKHDYPGSESFDALASLSWSFSPNDPSGAYVAYTEALSSLEERLAKGRAARRYAERHLSWDSAAAAVEREMGRRGLLEAAEQ